MQRFWSSTAVQLGTYAIRVTVIGLLATSRTGRAFVVSALTAMAGVAVLSFSSPPLLVWADKRNWVSRGMLGQAAGAVHPHPADGHGVDRGSRCPHRHLTYAGSYAQFVGGAARWRTRR